MKKLSILIQVCNPLELQYFITAQHPGHTDLSPLLQTDFAPTFSTAYTYVCLIAFERLSWNQSLSSPPRLTFFLLVHFPTVSLSPLGVMS